MERAHEVAPWFEGLSEGALTCPRCDACGRLAWPPRSACPFCASTTLTWVPLPTTATLFTWTTVHRTNLSPFADRVPYAVGVFEFADENVRLVGYVDSDPDGLLIGQTFRWRIDRTLNGEPTTAWVPDDAEGAQ